MGGAHRGTFGVVPRNCFGQTVKVDRRARSRGRQGRLG
jgi:hypothetical protein